MAPLSFQGSDGHPLLVSPSDPLPVDIGSASVNINGDVTLSSEVEVKNDVGNPVPASVGSLPLPSGAATAAKQDTLIAAVDGVEGLLGTIDADTGSIDGKLPSLQSGAVPVGDNGNSLTVDGKGYRAAVTITRPSNTTAYTAGDVIGVADGTTPANAGSAIITLPSIGPSGGYVLIQSVRLLIGATSVPSGMSGFRLHLYTASPTAILDNAAFDLVSGEVANYTGYIDLPTPQDLGSTLFTQIDYCGTEIKLASGSTSLFAELETRGAFTPASGTAFNLRVLTLEAGL